MRGTFVIDVQFEGLDDVLEALKDLEISEQKQRAVLSKCGDMVKEAKEEASAVLTGYTKNSIKKTNKKVDGAVAVEVKVTGWDSLFQEFGSSKVKKHVGKFANAVNSVEDKVAELIASELLK